MRAAIWTAAEHIELGERNLPRIRDDEVLVRVEAAGICGTDLAIYQGKFPKERARPPMVPGHEFCGTLADTGRDVRGFGRGDIVVVDPLVSCGACYACVEGNPHVCTSLKLIGVDMDGGFAEFVKAKAAKVHRVPEGMGFEEGAMVEPLSVAVHAVRRSGMKVGDRLLVTGGGPIGILTGLVAAGAGARTLVVTEIRDYRLGLLGELGLDAFNPLVGGVGELVRDRFGGEGPDVVFEVTGTSAGMQQAIDSVKHRGTIVEVGLPKDRTENDTRRMVFGEIAIVGSRVYAPLDIETSIGLIARRAVNVGPLMRGFPLEECPRLFRELSHGEGDLMKVILRV